MHFVAAKQFVSSIRFRLMLWSTLVLLIAIIAALVGVREGMRYLIGRELVEVLREDALQTAATIEPLLNDDMQIQAELNLLARSHDQRGLFAQLFDPSNFLVYATANSPSEEQLGFAPLPNETPTVVANYTLIDKVLSNGTRTVRLRVGEPQGLLAQQDIARLTQMVLLVGGVLIIVAPLGGYWLAGRTTRPLQQIIWLAQNAEPSQLRARLPIRGSNDEFDRLSGTINTMLDRIAAYIRARREFVTNAAHELRSPLTAIQSSVEVALNSPRTADDYRELLYDIVDECQRLRTLVNQLLMLAENEGGLTKTVRHPVQFEQIVGRAADMFAGVAEERGIHLKTKLEPIPKLLGDSESLRQLINNLIDNALKFTPRGGTVEVSLKCPPGSYLTLLTISDTGPGISEADLPHIFERFFRGDQSRQRNDFSGSGLGLAICSAVALAHGGKIDVTSKLGHGCSFQVWLPIQGAPFAAVGASPLAGPMPQ